ncbi:hypothetical protein PR048_028185 [Dryococelus australis]|uniref:Uncharacterized protein n=1 Tax=Dryococelus australis TaxID=614101 RepID=A0ABQ9GIJ3_9NEOP|nr:hypothetical protein PR048_028185 [Dryococelus australis]
MLWMCTSATSKNTLVKELLSFSIATQILLQSKEKHIVFSTESKLLTYISHTQSDFLANSQNKRALIGALITHLCKVNIEVYQATADADVQIIRVALQYAADGKRIIVVGQDTVILSTYDDIWFLKTQTGNKRENVFNIARKQEIHQHTRDVFLFCHGMSGCGTSSIFRKGKVKCLKLLEKEELRRKVTAFNEENFTHDDIVKAHEEFMLAIYVWSIKT